MGCDGGSIPKRTEMVKTKKKQEKTDMREQKTANWFFCFLSKERLKVPIVSCGLGRLYNKESVIQFLLNKEDFGEGMKTCSHIRSLKDVTTLNMKLNPEYKETTYDAVKQELAFLGISSQFLCPITNREMNGSVKFCFMKPCGCVVSEQAFKEIDIGNQCLVCNKEYKSIVPINGSPEEVEQLALALKKKRSRDKSDKTEEEQKKPKRENENASISSTATKKRLDKVLPDLEKKLAASKTSSIIQSIHTDNPSTADPSGLFRNTFSRYV